MLTNLPPEIINVLACKINIDLKANTTININENIEKFNRNMFKRIKLIRNILQVNPAFIQVKTKIVKTYQKYFKLIELTKCQDDSKVKIPEYIYVLNNFIANIVFCLNDYERLSIYQTLDQILGMFSYFPKFKKIINLLYDQGNPEDDLYIKNHCINLTDNDGIYGIVNISCTYNLVHDYNDPQKIEYYKHNIRPIYIHYGPDHLSYGMTVKKSLLEYFSSDIIFHLLCRELVNNNKKRFGVYYKPNIEFMKLMNKISYPDIRKFCDNINIFSKELDYDPKSSFYGIHAEYILNNPINFIKIICSIEDKIYKDKVYEKEILHNLFSRIEFLRVILKHFHLKFNKYNQKTKQDVLSSLYYLVSYYDTNILLSLEKRFAKESFAIKRRRRRHLINNFYKNHILDYGRHLELEFILDLIEKNKLKI